MGQTAYRADITAMTNASPCQVTTDEAHGYATDDYVRLTDLNGMIPVARGMTPINNGRFKIIVLDTTNFTLRDPITLEPIDSTGYAAYVEGGYCNKIAEQFTYNS